MAIKQAVEHPKQHNITLELSNKEKITIVTTWGKEGEVLKADIDPFNHPAWQDGNKTFVNPNNENMNKFKKKFSGFDNV
ncbi:MAG: ribosomal protein [Rickettsiaceae bacterium]|jgi:ribosomal protein L31|nr:ribosomal protein [Rickettsiaceae bacterium]